jgi:hypothetical protein
VTRCLRTSSESGQLERCATRHALPRLFRVVNSQSVVCKAGSHDCFLCLDHRGSTPCRGVWSSNSKPQVWKTWPVQLGPGGLEASDRIEVKVTRSLHDPPAPWHLKMPKRNGGVCVGIFGSPVICVLVNFTVHFRFVIFVVFIYNHFIRGWISGGGEIFRCRPDRPWGPPSLPYSGYRVYFREGGVNLPRRGVEYPPPSSAEVKEGVKQYFSPFGTSRPVLGWILPFPLNWAGIA